MFYAQSTSAVISGRVQFDRCWIHNYPYPYEFLTPLGYPSPAVNICNYYIHNYTSYTLPVTHSNTINTHLSHTLYVKHKFYTFTKYLSRNFLSQIPTQSTCLHTQYVHYTCHKLLNPSSKTIFRPTSTVCQTPARVCQELRRPSVLSRIHPLTKPLTRPFTR